MIPSLETMAGFFTGAGLVLLVFYIYYRIGKKKRRFDERYQQIHMLARTYSWSITLLVLTGAWLVLLIVEGPGLAYYVALSAYTVMLLSYLLSAFVLNRRL